MSFSANIDTGGTFTDGYFTDGERYWLAKVETTPHDFTVGFLACLEEGAKRIGFADLGGLLRRCDVIRFCTTLTTNALVQGRGTRLGLLASRGLADDLCATAAPGASALVEPDLIGVIDEEVDAAGAVVAMPRPEEVVQAARGLLGRGARALVVALPGSAREPANEREVQRILDAEYPPHLLGHVPVTLSHQVSRRPEDRLRATAALLNARVHALLARSLREAEDALRERSCSRPLLVVHADGGCARVAKTRALDTYASGPAAVVHGAGKLCGSRRDTSIAMDIGGTTTDLAFVNGPTPRLLPKGEICGHRAGQPSPEVWSLGLGGGSIARLAMPAAWGAGELRSPRTIAGGFGDPLRVPMPAAWGAGELRSPRTIAGGFGDPLRVPMPAAWGAGELRSPRTIAGGFGDPLRVPMLTVGPESAGALPGPASFDLGGTDATVTDACLVLGFFAPDGFFGGRRRLRLDLARRALERLSPDAEPSQTAAAIKETLEEQVAAAIRSHGRGVDLGSARILALGGGGGLHAASIAAKLGLHDVDVFPFSPAFGAFGASTLDVVHVYQASLQGQGATDGRLPLGAWFREIVAAARRDVEDEGFAASDLAFELALEHPAAEPGGIPAITRHAVGAGQEFLSLPGGTPPHMAWLRARLAISRGTEPAALAATPPTGAHVLGARRVQWAPGERERPTAVFSLDALAAETRLPGPCLVESEFATLAVPPDWTFTLEPNGWMHLHA
jgi:N-methylhydantoinase A/acetophenone carboxylase